MKLVTNGTTVIYFQAQVKRSYTTSALPQNTNTQIQNYRHTNTYITREQKLVLTNLRPAPLLGNHVDGLRVQNWLGIGAACDDDGDNNDQCYLGSERGVKSGEGDCESNHHHYHYERGETLGEDDCESNHHHHYHEKLTNRSREGRGGSITDTKSEGRAS